MENQKKYMPAAAILLVTFIGILILFFTVGVSNKIKEGRYIGQDVVSKNTISATATGDVYAKPDLAIVSFSVVNEAKTATEALTKNAEKINAVIDFVKSGGVDLKDLKTTNFSINPRYEWRKDGNERIFVGYEVSQSLEIKIRDLSKIGELIEGATGEGANQVGNLYFAVDNQDKISSEARQKAIDEAKTKAQELSSQLGVKLGKIVNFSEGGFSPIPIYYGLEKSIGMGGAAPQIETGENKISVTVTITYEIR